MTEVPIVHKLSELYKLFYGYLQSFPQKDKYAFGGKCEMLMIETLELLLAASNSSKDEKKNLIQKAAVKFDALKVFVRLAKELKLLDQKKYIKLETELVEIGRQLGGWQRFLKE